MTGHYLHLVEKRDAVLATARMSPAARARAMGTKHYQMVAKEHRIVVDCVKPEERTVETTDHVEVMRPRPRRPTRRYVKIENAAILDAVAEAFDVSLYAIIGGSQSKKAYRPRHAAALLLRTYLNLSFPKIAVALGRSDHVTARNAVQKAAHLLVSNPEWAERYHAARHALGLV